MTMLCSSFPSFPMSVSCCRASQRIQLFRWMMLLCFFLCSVIRVQGFVLPLTKTITVSSSSLLYAQSGQPRKNGVKPPRFTQQVHKDSNRPPKSKKNSTGKQQTSSMQQQQQQRRQPLQSNNHGPPQPWQSGKSIEDLESVMASRWGTNSATSTNGNMNTQKKPRPLASDTKALRQWDTKKQQQKDNDDDDEWILVDEDDDEDDFDMGLSVRKPVLDPWQKEELQAKQQKQQQNTKKPPQQQQRTNAVVPSSRPPPRTGIVNREFYDEEDEGYEYNDDSSLGTTRKPRNNNGSSSSSGRINVAHMIAPKPAGGRGTFYEDTDDEGGYFFNRNVVNDNDTTVKNPKPKPNKRSTTTTAAAVAAPVSKPKRDTEQHQQQENNGSIPKPPKRVRIPPSKPILDEQGQPLLLTVDQAMKTFQKATKTIDGNDDDDDDDNDSSLSMMSAASWSDLGITSPILCDNLDAMYCSTPLDVQDKACPPILTGQDVLVGTYTGSGKTLAFLTPLVQRLLWNVELDDEEEEVGELVEKNKDYDIIDDDDDAAEEEEVVARSPKASPKGKRNKGAAASMGLSILIVAPGRELASQIASVARELVQDTTLTVQLAIGGTTFSRNLEQIRKQKPNILVGTPGRIAELVVGKPGEKTGKLKIASLQALVLDEFDALLEYKPHRDPTRAVMEHLKRRHGDALQSVLCSATALDIADSAKIRDFLRPGYAQAMADDDDVLVTNIQQSSDAGDANKKQKVSTARVSRTVMHGVVHVPHKKLALETIRKILHTEPTLQQILIFADTPRKVDVVVEKLASMGIIAAALHGGMGSQKMDRAEVSKALRDGYVGIVVATEMAARGLDAPLLTHVINLDLPTDTSHYAHRAGRCGRGGRPGVVINFTTSPQERKVPQRFADSLGIDMYTVEPRAGQLVIVDPTTQRTVT